MLLRSVLSCATVSPRYSVSRAAFEFRNWSVSSATDASFVAMGLLYVVEKDRTDARMTKAPAQTHGALNPGEKLRTPAQALAFASLRRRSRKRAHRQPAVFGSVQRT